MYKKKGIKRKVYLNDYIYETIIICGYYILLHVFLTD